MTERRRKTVGAREFLTEYKNRTDAFLSNYLADRIKALSKADSSLGRELGESVSDAIQSGGKRVRAALVHCGYRAVGGANEDKINYASASIEILHTFFLIHDDIIDKSDMRRGKPTIHKYYRDAYERKGLLRQLGSFDKDHFASSAAIMAGDVCCSLAYEALFESGFEDKNTIEALKMMQRTVLVTAVGEMIDVITPLYKQASEEEVLRIHYLKTALYTVEAPLLLGAILHGADERILSSLSNYGSPVGTAFQIQDDILGIFGTEEELGKPIGSDVKEGKQTLLTVKAFENASSVQKDRLFEVMGNPDFTQSDIDDIKEIIRSTGSLDYSRNKAEMLVEQGKQALEGIAIRKDIKKLLFEIADYMIDRLD